MGKDRTEVSDGAAQSDEAPDKNKKLKNAFLIHLMGILDEPVTVKSLQRLEVSTALARRMLEEAEEGEAALPDIAVLTREVQDMMSAPSCDEEPPMNEGGFDLKELAQLVVMTLQERNRPTMKELLVSLSIAKKEGLGKVADYIEKQLLERVGEVGRQ